MDLNWVIQDKLVDGRTVTPAETAGRRFLDPDDPESVALLEKRRIEVRNPWFDPEEPPVESAGPRGFWIWLDFLLGGPSRRRAEHEGYMQRWKEQKEESKRFYIPIDQALPLFAAEDPPFVVQDAAPENKDALAEYAGPSCYDFDATVLDDEYNAVSAHASFEMKLQYTSELGLDRSPKEMLKLANDISWSLAHYLKNEPDKDQNSIDIAREVIPWLRFWGRAGHGFVVDY